MDAIKTKEPSKHVRHFGVGSFVITHNASSSAKRSILTHSTSQQQRKLDCVLLQSLSKPLSNRDECSRLTRILSGNSAVDGGEKNGITR